MSELPRREESSPSPRSPSVSGEPPSTKRASWRRWLTWGVILAVLGGGAFWFMRPQPKDPSAGLELADVQRRTVEARVTATGTLSALVTVQVGSQVSGRIQEILVDYNSPVKKGQVIARIDPQLLQAALERAKANLLSARANVQRARVEAENARRQAERAKTLRAQQFIAQQDLDTAEATAQAAQAQVTSAEASLAQAQAALNEAEVNVRYTTIVSPTDGIVISRSVDVGQTVAASLQTPTLFTIAEDLAKMQVDTSVSESDVGRLKDGMPTTFTVDAWPGQNFEGVIRQIRNAAQTVQNVVTYDAVIDVKNPDMKLKPGMTANVNITTARAENALTVPNAALRYRPPAPPPSAAPGAKEGRPGRPSAAPSTPPPPGSKTVYVLRDGRPTPVPVKAGVTDGSYTEVEGELNEGDRVITGQSAGAPGAAGAQGGGQRPGGGGMGGGMGGGRGRGPF
ncbi:efflux RND transporter periplasmic adaptor subunit [Archangium primigenium]|nr:efflux RND transporter periplasmic adaptor subunit [Archangium primigenium]MBM7113610.1 efflux RND transporter periplasmic adaptor subunit [Archangium primigenium]